MIVEGKLRPGQTLRPERLLAKQFAASRPSLREALLKLEVRGLLRVERSAGLSATDVTAPTIWRIGSPAAVMFPFDGVSQNWQISRAFLAKRQYR